MTISNMIKGVLCSSLCVLALCSDGWTQPDWVKQAVENARAIQPETEAGALYLLRDTEIEIADDGEAKHIVRQVVKLLASASSQHMGIARQISDTRRVKGLKGWLLRSNGRVEKLKDEYVFEVALGQTAGYYDDERTLTAAFPSVSVGDIVAFEYRFEEKRYWDSFHQGFVFQMAEPVVAARLKVIVPDGWELFISDRNLESVTFSRDGNTFLWECGYLPLQPDEPEMPPWRYVMRMVQVSAYHPTNDSPPQFRNWQAAARWTASMHEMSAVGDVAVRTLAEELCSGLNTSFEKLQAIATYIRDRIRYVAVEVDEGRFRPRSAGETCHNGYGDCKDKVALMRSLLEEAGISSRSALALTNGTVDPDFPTPFQFDHVIVAVPLAELAPHELGDNACVDGWLYFDPTNTSTPLGCLPTGLQGARVLKASEEDTGLVRLPHLDPVNRRRVMRAASKLDESFRLTADVTIVDHANWAAETRHHLVHSTTKELVEQYQRLFANTMQEPSLTGFTTGDDGDSVWVSFKLTGKYFVTEAGPLCLVKPDFFHADRPDDLTAEERVHPIWFGGTKMIETDVVWQLPDGFVVEEDSVSKDIECESSHLTASILSSQSRTSFNLVTEQRGYVMDVEEYESAKEYNQALRSLSRMRVVLNRQ